MPRKYNGSFRRGYRRFKRFRRRFRKRRAAKMTFSSYIPSKGNTVGKLISGGRTSAAAHLIGFPNNRVFQAKYFETLSMGANATEADEPYTLVYDMTDIRYPFVREGNRNVSTVDAGRTTHAWDTWRRFYNQYVVIGAQVDLTFTFGQSPEDPDPLIVGAQLSPSSGVVASGSTITDLIQNRKCVWTQMASSVSAGNYKLSLKYDAKKWHSLTDVSDADTLLILFTKEISSDQSNRSDDAVYLKVFSHIFDGTGTQQDCVVSLTITYTVLASDPRTLVYVDNPPYP